MDSFNFFQDGSPFLAHPLLTAERTAKEVDFLTSILNLPIPSRWLDVGCGFGRHTIELAKRGHNALGIDPAAAMVSAAQTRAATEKMKEGMAGIAQFTQQYGERFTTKTLFDAAICLFTSLGQITAQGENRGLVSAIHKALKVGGRFVVEVPQRATTIANLKTSEQFGSGERYTAVTRRYNSDNQTIIERFQVVSPQKSTTFHLQYRLYNYTELVDLLRQAGFIIDATFADFNGTPLQRKDPFMLFIGRKV